MGAGEYTTILGATGDGVGGTQCIRGEPARYMPIYTAHSLHIIKYRNPFRVAPPYSASCNLRDFV